MSMHLTSSLDQRNRNAVEATRIVPHLHQGSVPPNGLHVHKAGFDVLVLCAQEYQPSALAYPGVRVIHCPLDDNFEGLTQQEWTCAVRAASEVAEALRAGSKVLITCMQGRNRSGLVTAVTLYMVTGMSGAKAIEHIRSRRAFALSNPAFVSALRRLR